MWISSRPLKDTREIGHESRWSPKDSATMKEIGFAVEMLLSILKSGQGQPWYREDQPASTRTYPELRKIPGLHDLRRPAAPAQDKGDDPVGVRVITATEHGRRTVTRIQTSWRERWDEKIDQEQERF